MSVEALHEHLKTGHTHVCQCWSIERSDGVVFGFTDHDRPLEFDGITFLADSGMAAKALSGSTGLSVNNTEAIGLLQSDVIRDVDIRAGRFDHARVTNWLVCWDDVSARQVKFAGTIGEITMRNGAFEAELRGLTDALNQPQGRSYLRRCSAKLGDVQCGVNLDDPAMTATATVAAMLTETKLRLPVAGFNEGWFTAGSLRVLTGASQGLSVAIKGDATVAGWREIAIWEPFGAGLLPGDNVRLIAGCDKRAETCRVKFANFLNFRGFPHIPGEDWLMSVPRSDGSADGESLMP